MCDNKIRIFIEFYIRQSILICFGAANVWGAGPPKSQLLAGGIPNAYKEGHSTRPVGGISKKAYVFL